MLSDPRGPDRLAAGPALVSPALSRWTSDLHREVLPNGLTLLIQPDHSAPAVAVVTLVRAGFFDEPDRWVGVSHVLEHMFFKGTARRGPGDLARETRAAGGYLNAGTGYDHTVYYAVLPASGLAAALDLQADALRCSTIDAGELARELRVIIEEAKRKLDTPADLAAETLHNLMFDRHRIRRWRIGTEAQLSGYSREDIAGYYHSRYTPERTIVAVVGDVEPTDALARARAAYGDWITPAAESDPSPEEPGRREVRARTLRGDIVQAELALGWRAVPPLHEDAWPLELAAAVLSAGRGSWLYRTLREPGIVSWVSAHHYAPTELGVFSVMAELAPEQVAPAVAKIAEAVTRLALQGPEPEDLARARALVLARWVRRLETTDGRATALAQAEALGGTDLLEREYEGLATATAADLRRAASRWLLPDAVSGVAYLPTGRGADLSVEALGAAFAVTALTPLAPPVPVALPRPRPTAARGSETAGVLHLELPGVDLLIRRKPGVPLASVALYLPSTSFDPPEEAGLSALAIRSAVRGAGTLDAPALAFAFEGLGGSLATSVSADWSGFAATVLAAKLPEAAGLLRLVHEAPRHEDAAVMAERSVMIAEAEQVADDMLRYPFELAFGAGFGDRGYGRPPGGVPETLARLDPAAVRRRHAGLLAIARPVVAAVGDFDPARALDQLAGAFATLAPRPPAPAPAPEAWMQAEPLRLRERARAQTALAMLFPGPLRRDPERHAAQVWAAVGGGLGGRLFEELRGRRSLAYTVVLLPWARSRAGALLAYIATSPGREEEARDAMLAELARFAREPVSAEERDRAVNFLAGQLEVRRQSTAAVLGEMLEAWLIGAGLKELADPAAPLRAVTAEQVRAMAARWLDPAGRVEGVVRGREDDR